MKKLSAAQLKTRDEIYVNLQSAKGTLEDEITAYNTAVSEKFAAVEASISEYNAALEAAREWRDDIVAEIDEYVSERSERWQNSDAASEMEAWKGEFEGLSLDDIELESPDELAIPDEVDDEVLNNVPE